MSSSETPVEGECEGTCKSGATNTTNGMITVKRTTVCSKKSTNKRFVKKNTFYAGDVCPGPRAASVALQGERGLYPLIIIIKSNQVWHYKVYIR